MKRIANKQNVVLFEKVANILEQARSSVVRAVNTNTVTAYWLIGKEIVTALQRGEERAEYGARLIEDLSARLTERFGNGFSTTNLKYFRLFYLAFQNRRPVIDHPMGDESALLGKRHPKGDKSPVPLKSFPAGSYSFAGFHSALSWSHYRALMRIEDQSARDFYEKEIVECGWNKRELERQITTKFYERLLLSKDKKGMLLELKTQKAPNAIEVLKDPYILEFLDLPNVPRLHESDLEAAIIDNLQSFLLELGRGFSFVARQKQLRFDDKDFYVDLVFYNFHLKCFVLIDLKIGELTHQDIGQMDGYVRVFEEHGKGEGDNPTIGLILCSEKNEAIARYSVLRESRNLFASKYKLYLPSEKDLKRELERERRVIEEQREEKE